MIPIGGNPQKRTNKDFLDSMLANAHEAAQRLAEARRVYHSLLPGDPRINGDKHTPGALEEVRRAFHDEKHWRTEVTYWRGRCLEEGEDHVPALKYEPPRSGRRADYLQAAPVQDDPIVQAELEQRRQAELARLADKAARERVPGGDDDDLGDPREAAF